VVVAPATVPGLRRLEAALELHGNERAVVALLGARRKTNEITVERLDNEHDGSVTPVEVRQAGEAGHLMAEWFEYTPTPGTDVQVTSNLATIV